MGEMLEQIHILEGRREMGEKMKEVGLEGVGNENGRGAAGGGSRVFVFRSWEWEGRARV